MSEIRENIVGIFCGNRNVGKTTFILDVIKDHKKKVLVYDLDDNDKYAKYQLISPDMLSRWKRGIKRIVTPDYETVFDEIAENVHNTLLILEDATKYIDSEPSKAVKRIILAAKARNIDIIMTFHCFRAIPPKLIGWSDYIEIFKTGESIAQFKNKIPLFERVEKAHAEVEAHESQYFHKTVMLR